MTWAIYGATGFTGGLIAAEAALRGEQPLLLGRSEERLSELADFLGLEFAVVTDETLPRRLKPVDLVINAAGPSASIIEPVLTACISAGTHYLDLSNEFSAVQYVFAQAARARAVGITVVPSVGFGTVATDAVAQHAVDRMPGCVAVEVASFADNARGGAATSATVVDVLGSGGMRVVDGHVQRAPLGRGIRRIRTPIGSRSLVPIATGDLVTVRYTTGVRTVSASVGFAVPTALLTTGLPALGFAARARLVRGLPELPHRADYVFRSFAWARATDADGNSATSWLSTGEGYAFSASAAVLAAIGVLQNPLAGVATIAGVLGADFALEIPGTTISSLGDRGQLV